jgi:hypothetical protein
MIAVGGSAFATDPTLRHAISTISGFDPLIWSRAVRFANGSGSFGFDKSNNFRSRSSSSMIVFVSFAAPSRWKMIASDPQKLAMLPRAIVNVVPLVRSSVPRVVAIPEAAVERMNKIEAIAVR